MNIEDYRDEKSYKDQQLQNELQQLKSKITHLTHQNEDLRDKMQSMSKELKNKSIDLQSLVGQVLNLNIKDPIQIQLMQGNARSMREI